MWTEESLEWANQFDPELDEMIKATLRRRAIDEAVSDNAFLRSVGAQW